MPVISKVRTRGPEEARQPLRARTAALSLPSSFKILKKRVNACMKSGRRSGEARWLSFEARRRVHGMVKSGFNQILIELIGFPVLFGGIKKVPPSVVSRGCDQGERNKENKSERINDKTRARWKERWAGGERNEVEVEGEETPSSGTVQTQENFI